MDILEIIKNSETEEEFCNQVFNMEMTEDNIKILSESIVIGDIISPKIQIEDNAIFHGHCISIKDTEIYNSESEKYLQSKAIKEKVIL